MNAPLVSYGGKSGMYNKILNHFPSPEQYNTYIEPFAGSFIVGLKKDPSKVEIFNDLNKNIYSVYKVISDKDLFSKFKEKCDLVYYSEDLRKEFKEKLKNLDLSLVDRAFYFFCINRMSHNGIGGLSTTTIVRRNMSKSISDLLSTIDKLPEMHQRLSRVIILNTNGIDLVKKYNQENIMMYMDPPYHHSTRTAARYEVDMDNEQQEKFIDAVIENKSKILISGYDCEPYDRLINNGFTKHHFDVKTIDGNFKPKTKVETVWKNY